MDRTRSQYVDDTADAPLDMSRLRRVALWGTAAAATLTAAVLVGMSDTGKQRMNFAVASWSKQDRPDTRLASAPTASPAPAPIIVQRDLEAMAEARRLAESVKTLSADRDRLATRLANLERSFEDVTGSIKREISAVRPTPPHQLPPIDLPSMAEKPASPATSSLAPAKTPPPQKAAAVPTPLPEPDAPPATVPAPAAPIASTVASAPAFLPPATDPAPAPAPPPAAAAPVPVPVTVPSKLAAAPIMVAPLDPPLVGGPDSGIPAFGLPGMPALPPGHSPDVTGSAIAAATKNGASVPRTEFGIDIGGASNIEMLRAQWAMLKQQHPALLEKLQPVVSVRDLRQRRSVELRLVAGPLGNANAAAELCAALNAAGVASCQPAVFDGQRLTMR